MFEGIKLLCMHPKADDPYLELCLHPLIVTRERYLKIANMAYTCPRCGYKSKTLGKFFRQVQMLQKTVEDMKTVGFFVEKYEIAFMACQEDEFDFTPHILEHDDWIDWNMQISLVRITNMEDHTMSVDLWEDHFFKSRPFIYPSEWKHAFNAVLRKKALYIMGCEAIDFKYVKNLINDIRNYNKSWHSLLNAQIAAVPVDLKDPLYTSIAKGQSLDELFQQDKYE